MYVKCKLILVCLEIVLVSVQDSCTVCAEGTIGLEIILDTPDGTPIQAHPMVLLRDISQMESHFGPYGDTINLDTR
jgi:hypothetical protein